MTTLEELERLMREALALVRLGPLTKHEHQKLDSLMTRAINALPGLIESARRVERLEAALKPFAHVVDLDVSEFCSDSDWFAPMSAQYARAPRLTVGDLRRARAALKGT